MPRSQAHQENYQTLHPYGFTHDDIDALARVERHLSRVAERLCSGYPVVYQGRIIMGWNETAAAADERMQEYLEARARRIAQRHGCEARFNHDPRGGMIQLLLPPGPDGRRPSNSMHGDCWILA